MELAATSSLGVSGTWAKGNPLLTLPYSQSQGQLHLPELCAISNGDSWFPKSTATGLAVAAMGRGRGQELI